MWARARARLRFWQIVSGVGRPAGSRTENYTVSSFSGRDKWWQVVTSSHMVYVPATAWWIWVSHLGPPLLWLFSLDLGSTQRGTVPWDSGKVERMLFLFQYETTVCICVFGIEGRNRHNTSIWPEEIRILSRGPSFCLCQFIMDTFNKTTFYKYYAFQSTYNIISCRSDSGACMFHCKIIDTAFVRLKIHVSRKLGWTRERRAYIA